jgi:hypothetical protein
VDRGTAAPFTPGSADESPALRIARANAAREQAERDRRNAERRSTMEK